MTCSNFFALSCLESNAAVNQNVSHSRRWLYLIWGVAWVIFLSLPIAFLFSKAGTPLSCDWLSGLYAAFVEVLGEQNARWGFCGLWVAGNAALFWRLVISKRRHDLGDPVDLDD